jgi:putative NADH-flavin reductase
MKVLIFGANGKTGSLVVDRALTAGHEVTVLVHDPAKFAEHRDPASRGTDRRVAVFTGDATNPTDIRAAMAGQQAVIDTIGGTTPYKSIHLEADAAKAILAEMQAASVKRLIVVSALGVNESAEQAPFWYRYLLMPTFLRGSTKDKAAMEEEVKTQGIDFVIVRPPMLSDDPPTGSVTVIGPLETGHKITRTDLAGFLVDQLSSDQYLNQAVTVVNS